MNTETEGLPELLAKLDTLVGLDWQALAIDGVADVERAGALLLLTIHKGFNTDVWGKKRTRYWDAFQEKVELALMAGELPEFVSMLAREMSATVGRNDRQREVAVRLTYHPRRQEIYDNIRTSYEMLITLARVMQGSIKAQYDYDENTEDEE
jgi:hypothetical protein